MLRYEQAEVVEHELQHMTEQVKSIIQTMNATQVTHSYTNRLGIQSRAISYFPCLIQGGELESADSMTPFDVAVRILDNQLRSLMWIDEKVRIFAPTAYNYFCLFLFLSVWHVQTSEVSCKNKLFNKCLLHYGPKIL